MLRTEHDGELPVGDAVMIKNGDTDYRYFSRRADLNLAELKIQFCEKF